jgi:hypothetical protein
MSTIRYGGKNEGEKERTSNGEGKSANRKLRRKWVRNYRRRK